MFFCPFFPLFSALLRRLPVSFVKKSHPTFSTFPSPAHVHPLPPFSTMLSTENGRESVSTKQQRGSYNSWGPSLLSQQLGTFSALTAVGDMTKIDSLLCSHSSWGHDKNRFSSLLSQQLGPDKNRFSPLLSQQLGT